MGKEEKRKETIPGAPCVSRLPKRTYEPRCLPVFQTLSPGFSFPALAAVPVISLPSPRGITEIGRADRRGRSVRSAARPSKPNSRSKLKGNFFFLSFFYKRTRSLGDNATDGEWGDSRSRQATTGDNQNERRLQKKKDKEAGLQSHFGQGTFGSSPIPNLPKRTYKTES